ncbi:MAG: glycosyltransferase family 4 protein [Lentisphaerae bacterium]|nr:glycosyltransferase family 4 protein [Lentisphaerota bacterium]
MSIEKQLAIFCRYGEKGASSRVRFFRYRPFFERAGITPLYHSFFDDAYLQQLYSGGGRSAAALPRGFFRRLRELRQTPPDTPLLIEYELFPLLWEWCELLFLKNRKFFLNFDDPVWEKYAKIPTLRSKYDSLVSRAAGVIVANDLLFDRFSKLNPRIIKIPTAIDLDRYTAAGSGEKFKKFTIVWIGSPATFHYLNSFQRVLREMSAHCDFELLIIGKKSWGALPGIPGYSVDWSEETEAELLSKAHLGIMPLPEESFAKGKSAYKLIQYGGAGIPALASAVGENCQIIEDGKNGFLCRTPEEWTQKLLTIFHNADLRKEMGKAGFQKAQEWSLAANAPKLIEFIFGGAL